MTVACDAESCKEILSGSFTNLRETDQAAGNLARGTRRSVPPGRKRMKENPFSYFTTPTNPTAGSTTSCSTRAATTRCCR